MRAAWLMPNCLGVVLACSLTCEAWAETPAPSSEAVQEREAVLLDTSVDEDDEALLEAAEQLDALLIATLQDLGRAIELSPERRSVAPHELARFATESDKLVVKPTLRLVDGEYELKIVAAHPGSKVLRVRVERAEASELQVRAVVLLRDVTAEPVPEARAPKRLPSEGAMARATRSEGRAILATNGTIFGGFLGYSIQRSSGSDDPRLLYPLMAVGAGAGLGAAIIASDEWDVGVGESLYLVAGTWWPAAAGHLIHAGRFGATSTVADEQWTFGLIGSVTGVSLSTALLVGHGVGMGGAVLAHSGGAAGLVLGGLADMGVSGIHDAFPLSGMGYGAAGGWLAASAAAILFEPDETDVLVVDLGVLLGGLAGASAASPLLFDDPSVEKTRGWVGASAAGLLIGGTVGYFLRPEDGPPSAWWRAVPSPGRVGIATAGEVDSRGYGLRWHGPW